MVWYQKADQSLWSIAKQKGTYFWDRESLLSITQAKRQIATSGVRPINFTPRGIYTVTPTAANDLPWTQRSNPPKFRDTNDPPFKPLVPSVGGADPFKKRQPPSISSSYLVFQIHPSTNIVCSLQNAWIMLSHFEHQTVSPQVIYRSHGKKSRLMHDLPIYPWWSSNSIFFKYQRV